MIGTPELMVMLFMVLAPVAGVYCAYWVVRLAVRHGMEDVHRRAPGSALTTGLGSAPAHARQVDRAEPT
jgi:hypothetical protein